MTERETTLAAFEKIVRDELERLQAKRDELSSEDWARSLRTAVQAQEMVASLTGEGAEIPDARLRRSATFKRLLARIAKALEPWPEAMRAVGEELAKGEA